MNSDSTSAESRLRTEECSVSSAEDDRPGGSTRFGGELLLDVTAVV